MAKFKRQSKVVDISLIGDKELIRRFQRLDRKSGIKVFKPSSKKAVEVQKPVAKVAARTISSRISKGLRVRLLKTKKTGFHGAFLGSPTREKLGIPRSSKYYFPAAHEYGTRFLDRNSFLRSTFLASEQRIKAKLQSEMRRRINSLWSKG